MNKKITILIAAIVLLGGVFYLSGFGDGKVVPLKPTEVVELKDGDVYKLTASYVKKEINGQTYKMLAYNGSIPGPLIKVPQGGEVTIDFKNDTDLPTLLHSHGVRMDNAFDGSQTSQKEIAPGDSFVYKLKFPDAGMFWYHPHVREDLQQELGMYGGFLVTPKDENYWSPVNREVPLFVDDILIEGGKINLSKIGADHTLMGRYGNVMLVNGETDYKLLVKKGEVVRFYLVNAANVRPLNIVMHGSRMKLVGGDNGAYEKDRWVEAVTLGPSERAVVEVLFAEAGSYSIRHEIPPPSRDDLSLLGWVEVTDEPVEVSYAAEFQQLKNHQAVSESIKPFLSYLNKAPDKLLALTVDMGPGMMGGQMGQGMGHGAHMMPDGTMMGGSMMSASPDGIEWEDDNQMMNQMANSDSILWKVVDQTTGKENMAIDWVFKKGDPVKIRIFNDPKSMHPMQHPIHFHGQRFLVVARDGVSQTNLVWKDTVLIPAGQTVDILLDTSNPGIWMAHCHIAEHLEAGMMFAFKVE